MFLLGFVGIFVFVVVLRLLVVLFLSLFVCILFYFILPCPFFGLKLLYGSSVVER